MHELKLFNFKNYAEANLQFSEQVNCFLGSNGSGKTNLLDAMHYLSFTKSAVNPADAQNVKLGESQFMIKGGFTLGGKAKEVVCSFQVIADALHYKTGKMSNRNEKTPRCLREAFMEPAATAL